MTKRPIRSPVIMRDKILDATERLLSRYGYAKMTVEDIAREAGIGKGTRAERKAFRGGSGSVRRNTQRGICLQRRG